MLTGSHEEFGPYRLVAKLGEGGNGEVWRATGPDGDVAIKVLKRRPPGDAVPRFVREIEALNRLKGVPGVLPLLDADQTAARWFAMPIATTMVGKLGPDASLQEICSAMSAIADALSRVHAMGISHRDVKPGNLYWQDNQWCLGDFGLADFNDAEPITSSGQKLGPAHYIAPEMLNEAADAQGPPADVYSLGKTLWVLATGQRYPLPGAHDPTFEGAKIGRFNVDQRRSGFLDEVIRNMTQLDPSRRPPADSVSRELAIIASDPASTTGAPDAAASFSRLRAAIAPERTRRQLEEARRQLCHATKQKIDGAIYKLAQAVRRETGLHSELWDGAPAGWGTIGSVELEDAIAYVTVAGGPTVSWRFLVGAKLQLLPDEKLLVTLGYDFEQLINGMPRGLLGQQVPRWSKRVMEQSGSAALDARLDDVLAELVSKFPEMIGTFARLINEAQAPITQTLSRPSSSTTPDQHNTNTASENP